MARQPAHVVAEAACEIKFGQVGIAQLRVRDDDADAIFRELSEKVAAAPQLFSRAAVCLDLSSLSPAPPVASVDAILAAIRNAGLIPVGLSYGTPEVAELAVALGLPVIAKFRASYERAGGAVAAEAPAERPAPRRRAVVGPVVEDYLPADVVQVAAPAPALAPPAPAPTPAAPAAVATSSSAQRHTQPVRSGQRVYARGRDLVVHAPVGAGAEVIADGSVHLYAPLRGRALAGAQGDASARIYCLDFQAELVAIAGNYKVFEEIPAEFRGKPVQIHLDGDQIVLSKL